jgi:MFS family permease
VHAFLTPVGIWTITYLTFVLFFASGLLLYLILRPTSFFIDQDLKFVVLIFMIVPVNHARISAIIFQYTTSYYLFFLGWFLLVRYKSIKIFVLACATLFLSFKTHSFLFFYLLPFIHFCWLNKMQIGQITTLNKRHSQLAIIVLLPISYLLMRDLFWPPSEEWASYQRPGMAGLVRWLPFSIPFLLGFILFSWNLKFKKNTTKGIFYLWIGSGITALALLPYFLIGYFRPYASLIALRAEWGTRNQILMPLGLALSVVGLNELLKWRGKNIVVSTILVISLALNMFWGSQYFLQSHKQEQLVELFKTTKDKVEIASVEDQTKRFNGRESTFRSYEWNGFMTLAGIPTDRPGCEALPSGSVLTLKSDTSYLQAFLTRDLGLYFDVKPCSEVLAQNN